MDYEQEGDPFDEGNSSVTRYQAQGIARRFQSDLTHGDRRLDTSPLSRLEKWFGNPTVRATREAEDRADHARALDELAAARGDLQIEIERMVRSTEIGRTRAEAEIADNKAKLAEAEARRQEALTRGRSAAELAEMDIDIERRRRQNEIARLEREAQELRKPTAEPVSAQEQNSTIPEHPLITELKAELGTYQQVRLELRKMFEALQAQKDRLSAEEYEHRLNVLETCQADVMSRVSVGGF